MATDYTTFAGEMRERVIVQEQTPSADGGGGAVINWTSLATVWAEVKPVSVSDNVKALALSVDITHKITVRWRSDLGTFDSNRYRLMWKGRIVRINGISNPDQRNRFLELTCQMGQAVAA